MKGLSRLNNDILLKIIAAEKFKNLLVILGKERSKKLLEEASNFLETRLRANHKALLMMRSITNTPSIPFILLWTLISLTTLSFTFIAILSGITALVTLVIAPIMYYGTKQEEDITRRLMLKELTLAVIKQEATKALLQRHYSDDAALISSLPSKNPSEEVIDKKKFLIHLQKGIGYGFEVSSTLFCTFFAGGYAILFAFEAVGAAAFLLSGVGLGISVGICLVAGCYFGIQQYRASREESYCAAWLKQSAKLIEKTSDKVEGIKELGAELQPSVVRSSLTFFSPASNPPSSTPRIPMRKVKKGHGEHHTLAVDLPVDGPRA